MPKCGREERWQEGRELCGAVRGRPAALGGRGGRDGSGGDRRRSDHLTMPVRKEQSPHKAHVHPLTLFCENEAIQMLSIQMG